MPKPNHQFILFLFLKMLDEFVGTRNLRHLLPASLRVYLWAENLHRFVEDFCDGADLVVEIVSGSYDER